MHFSVFGRHSVSCQERDIDAAQRDGGLRFSAKKIFKKSGSLRSKRTAEPFGGGVNAYNFGEYFATFRC